MVIHREKEGWGRDREARLRREQTRVERISEAKGKGKNRKKVKMGNLREKMMEKERRRAQRRREGREGSDGLRWIGWGKGRMVKNMETGQKEESTIQVEETREMGG